MKYKFKTARNFDFFNHRCNNEVEVYTITGTRKIYEKFFLIIDKYSKLMKSVKLVIPSHFISRKKLIF